MVLKKSENYKHEYCSMGKFPLQSHFCANFLTPCAIYSSGKNLFKSSRVSLAVNPQRIVLNASTAAWRLR